MFMVTPYMDHDLSGLLENPDVHFTEPQIKCYMLQLLEGLRFLHNVGALFVTHDSVAVLQYHTTDVLDHCRKRSCTEI